MQMVCCGASCFWTVECVVVSRKWDALEPEEQEGNLMCARAVN